MLNGGVQLTTGPFWNKFPGSPFSEAGMAGSINIIDTSWKDFVHSQHYPARPKNHWANSNTCSQKRKTAEDYAEDRVGKYAQYFEKYRILPIPELVKAVELKTLSFVISDLRTRRLVRLKKETFEELLKTAGIPCRYFCKQSFATWDVLLPSGDLAKKLAGDTITKKFFWLQPEYKGHKRIRVTMCNVLIELNRNFLAAYLSNYGGVEEVLPARLAAGTAHGDYIINICLNREGFQAISHIIAY